MDDGERENVISVELAIQRELAYRKQVSTWQLHPYGVSKEKLMPLEVQFPSSCQDPNLGSSPSSSWLKRVAAPSDPECSTSQPHFSEVECPSPSQGSSGKKRVAGPTNTGSLPSKQLRQTDGREPINHRADLCYCEICEISCTGPQSYWQHKRGQKHQLKLKELNCGKSSGELSKEEASKERHWCNLCKVWCTTAADLKQHISGQKHKRNRMHANLNGNSYRQKKLQ